MNGYLERLAARSIGTAPTLRPRMDAAYPQSPLQDTEALAPDGAAQVVDTATPAGRRSADPTAARPASRPNESTVVGADSPRVTPAPSPLAPLPGGQGVVRTERIERVERLERTVAPLGAGPLRRASPSSRVDPLLPETVPVQPASALTRRKPLRESRPAIVPRSAPAPNIPATRGAASDGTGTDAGPDTTHVEIRIGRIEVVAPAPPQKAALPSRRARPHPPMALGEYFERRRGGRP